MPLNGQSRAYRKLALNLRPDAFECIGGMPAHVGVGVAEGLGQGENGGRPDLPQRIGGMPAHGGVGVAERLGQDGNGSCNLDCCSTTRRYPSA